MKEYILTLNENERAFLVNIFQNQLHMTGTLQAREIIKLETKIMTAEIKGKDNGTDNN